MESIIRFLFKKKMDNFDERYKIICSSETLYSNRKGFFHQFCDNVRQMVGNIYIRNLFSKLEQDTDRILNIFTNSNFEIINNVLHKVSKLYRKKDAFNSKIKRIECLRLYENENFIDILNQINQAVLLAPEISACPTIDNGYTLLLALVTRTDILLKHNEYILAYKEIKNIMKLDVSFIKKSKMLYKALICRSEMNSMVHRDFSIEFKCCKGTKVSEAGMEKNLTDKCLSDSIKIVRSDTAGKEAVAKSIINPGDILIAENPTASCLLPRHFNSHCQTCFKRFKVCYGCPDCSTVSFCSYKCKDIGIRSYHKYECKILSVLIGSGMSILSLLALRIITQLGLQKCLYLYKLLINGKMDEEFKDYLKLYQLEHHTSKRSANDYYERMLMTVFMVQCLKQVDFFNHPSGSNQFTFENQIIVGLLLIKNLQLLQFNAHEIYENNSLSPLDVYTKKIPLYIGVGIYITAARFNHHCYPATIRYFNGNMIILRSSRLLQEDDVIAENYGPVFIKKTFFERQRYLAGRYWFRCRCQACLNDWPLLNKIKNNYIRIRCQLELCTDSIDVYFNNDFYYKYYCQKCNSVNTFSREHQNITKKCIIGYARGMTLLNKQQLPEAAAEFLKTLKIFHHIANVPHRFTHLAEIGLQYCFMNDKY